MPAHRPHTMGLSASSNAALIADREPPTISFGRHLLAIGGNQLDDSYFPETNRSLRLPIPLPTGIVWCGDAGASNRGA